jgi:hypothetical protein
VDVASRSVDLEFLTREVGIHDGLAYALKQAKIQRDGLGSYLSRVLKALENDERQRELKPQSTREVPNATPTGIE